MQASFYFGLLYQNYCAGTFPGDARSGVVDTRDTRLEIFWLVVTAAAASVDSCSKTSSLVCLREPIDKPFELKHLRWKAYTLHLLDPATMPLRFRESIRLFYGPGSTI